MSEQFKGRGDVYSSISRGVASDKPHAVVTIRWNCGARRLGTTCIRGRYPRNERPSFRRVGCAIDDNHAAHRPRYTVLAQVKQAYIEPI